MAWHSVLDAAKYQYMPLAAGFVDFTNAFPSVSWKAIQAALIAYGVPDKLRTAVMSMYNEPKGRVKTSDGPTDPFPITQGVMQGDTLAPFLFVSVLNLVLRDAIEPQSSNGIIIREARGSGRVLRHMTPELRLTDMDYADDIVLLSHTVEGLKSLMEAVETRAASVGLKVNFKPGKTEYMVFNIPDAPPLICNGKPVVLTKEYKYLGSLCAVEQHIKMRIAMAVKANMKLTTLWRSSLPLYTKLRLFRCLVEPVLLYGLQGMGLSPAQLQKLDGAFTRMLLHVHMPVVSQSRLTVAQIYAGFRVPPVSATIMRLHLSLLGCVARTGLPTAKAGALQPAFYLHLWTAPSVTGALPLPARAPALVNTAVRFSGLELAQLRSEVLSCSSAEWHAFCNERAKTRSITYGEDAEDAGERRSANKRLDEAVAGLVASRVGDAHLAAEAIAARTVDNKLRLLRAHGVDLEQLINGLHSAGVMVELPSGVAPAWKTVVVVKGSNKRKCYVAGSGDDFQVAIAVDNYNNRGLASLLLNVMEHCQGCHVQLEAEHATVAQIEFCTKPRRRRDAPIDGGEEGSAHVGVQFTAALDTTMAGRRAGGLALRVVEADTSTFLVRQRSKRPTTAAQCQLEERHERILLQKECGEGIKALAGLKSQIMAALQTELKEKAAFATLLAKMAASLERAQLRQARREEREAKLAQKKAAKKAPASATALKKEKEKAMKPVKAKPYTAEQSVAALQKIDAKFEQAKWQARQLVLRQEAKLSRARGLSIAQLHRLEGKVWSARRRESEILRQKEEKKRLVGGAKEKAKLATKKTEAGAAEGAAPKVKKCKPKLKAPPSTPAQPTISSLPAPSTISTALVVRAPLELAVTTLVVAVESTAEALPAPITAPCCVAHRVLLAGRDPFAILSVGGTSLDASSPSRIVLEAYRRLMLQVHPDKSNCSVHGGDALSRLQEARTQARRCGRRPRGEESSVEATDAWGRPWKKRRVERDPGWVAVGRSRRGTAPTLALLESAVEVARSAPIEGESSALPMPIVEVASSSLVMRAAEERSANVEEESSALPTPVVEVASTSLVVRAAEEEEERSPALPASATIQPCCVAQRVVLARGCLFAVLSIDGESVSEETPKEVLVAAWRRVMLRVHTDSGGCWTHASEATPILTAMKAQIGRPKRSRDASADNDTSEEDGPQRPKKRRRTEAGGEEPRPLSEAVQRDFVKQRTREAQKKNVDGRAWLVARWSQIGGEEREWLGYATGHGGKYPQVKWVYERSSVRELELGAHADDDGDWWLPLRDDDGDEATFVTSVPDSEGTTLVHELSAYTHAPPRA